MMEQTFHIQGMDCAGCARTIETAVSQMPDVQEANLTFTNETLRLRGDISRESVTARVRELGFDVIEAEEAAAIELPQSFWHFMWQRGETRWALLGAILILPGILLTEILRMEFLVTNVMAIGAMVAAGWPIVRSAWRELRVSREVTINLLMSIAAVGAIIIGAYVEAGLVMVLFALGEALEGYASSRARQAIRSLMQVMHPKTTKLVEENGRFSQQAVPIRQLAIGDQILVRPGERIAADGAIMQGETAVDQAPITGESVPVPKSVGDTVFASSINGTAAITVRVTHLAEDSTISRLIKLVEEAQSQRAPTQRIVDRFARLYTPAVMAIAFLVAVVPPLLFNQPFWSSADPTSGWLYRGLALLVVACPCALVLSTPVSIVSALSNAARNGVLIKGGAVLERLGQVNMIALDKTGTITKGKPAVAGVRTAVCEDGDCADCHEVLQLAAAVEQQSEHPLAAAVLQEIQTLGLIIPAAQNVHAMTGQGIMGEVASSTVVVGSHRYFDAHLPHDAASCARAEIDAANGLTTLLVGKDGQYVGAIQVADAVRESSREAIGALNELDVETVMLTGDHAAVAQRVGKAVGVDGVQAELMPEEKLTAVSQLQAEGKVVAMVGDGINDAPALALADVGIAIGGAHNHQAMETAEITLMRDGLSQLPMAIRLSHATRNIIFANVAASLGIKGVFMLLVLAGTGTMWMAVLADVGTSLLVTLNGLRLLKK